MLQSPVGGSEDESKSLSSDSDAENVETPRIKNSAKPKKVSSLNYTLGASGNLSGDRRQTTNGQD